MSEHRRIERETDDEIRAHLANAPTISSRAACPAVRPRRRRFDASAHSTRAAPNCSPPLDTVTGYSPCTIASTHSHTTFATLRPDSPRSVAGRDRDRDVRARRWRERKRDDVRPARPAAAAPARACARSGTSRARSPGGSRPREKPYTSMSFSYPAYTAMRDHVAGFSSVALQTYPNPLSFGLGAAAHPVNHILVSGSYFTTLGVNMVLGRPILPSDDVLPNGSPVVVIGYGLWQRELGGDRNVVGTAVNLAGRQYTIIGVAPRAHQHRHQSDRRLDSGIGRGRTAFRRQGSGRRSARRPDDARSASGTESRHRPRANRSPRRFAHFARQRPAAAIPRPSRSHRPRCFLQNRESSRRSGASPFCSARCPCSCCSSPAPTSRTFCLHVRCDGAGRSRCDSRSASPGCGSSGSLRSKDWCSHCSVEPRRSSSFRSEVASCITRSFPTMQNRRHSSTCGFACSHWRRHSASAPRRRLIPAVQASVLISRAISRKERAALDSSFCELARRCCSFKRRCRSSYWPVPERLVLSLRESERREPRRGSRPARHRPHRSALRWESTASARCSTSTILVVAVRRLPGVEQATIGEAAPFSDWTVGISPVIPQGAGNSIPDFEEGPWSPRCGRHLLPHYRHAHPSRSRVRNSGFRVRTPSR